MSGTQTQRGVCGWGGCETYIFDEFVGLDHSIEAGLGSPGEIRLLGVSLVFFVLVNLDVGNVELDFGDLKRDIGLESDRYLGGYKFRSGRLPELRSAPRAGSASYLNRVEEAPCDREDRKGKDDVVSYPTLDHRGGVVLSN